MKLIGFIFILSTMIGCDPYGFGFKQNPAYVLNEAFEAVLALDPEAFIEVTGKEALCIYGNTEGVNYLRSNLNLTAETVDIKPKLVANSSKYTKAPQYVGYWSYYKEKYQIDILEKVSQTELLKVLVECHYGFEGEKNDKYQNLKPKKYKKKECRVVKVVPFKFKELPLRAECENLRVDL